MDINAFQQFLPQIASGIDRSCGRLGPVDPMAALVEHGMLLESARGPLPNVAEMVAGEPIRGSWWGHPASHAIFDELNALAASPDVVRTRLVNGKVTLVHRRLWPAVARVAERFPPERVAAIREEHTSTGAHRVLAQPFPDWVPSDVLEAAHDLSADDALAQLPSCLRHT
jgi:hypothetical protein